MGNATENKGNWERAYRTGRKLASLPVVEEVVVLLAQGEAVASQNASHHFLDIETAFRKHSETESACGVRNCKPQQVDAVTLTQ